MKLKEYIDKTLEAARRKGILDVNFDVGIDIAGDKKDELHVAEHCNCVNRVTFTVIGALEQDND